MARVPDMFEDLKDCYSENEDYSSAIDHLSLTQKSFYDASYGSLHENCMDEFVCLRTSETSKTSKFTVEESLVMVAATSNRGKILKKRRLSFNPAFASNNLESMTNDLEETIQPRSASYNFQSDVKYRHLRTVKQGFVLNDSLQQNIYRDGDDVHLKAASLSDLQHEVKFDMDAYSSGDDTKYPVTLRISNSQLFVSAQDENQPVLLKEMPNTPKLITGNETNLIFFWKSTSSMNNFESAAYPDLFFATKERDQVHLARGLPSMIDFQIP
ncbi:interleukin-1 alpha [Nannospalax galili]|uniref:Interleukin-1 n=1 Tax=Nannospalax galili TaxID=1026970 RepID=A0A8C6R5F9_NANGA|nr:interleukin-1 alpha [Nannospalax galili]